MEKCPKCGSTNIVSVEYSYTSPHRYDGVSEYNCFKCGYRQGRWTGFELHPGEAEPRFGQVWDSSKHKLIKAKHPSKAGTRQENEED